MKKSSTTDKNKWPAFGRRISQIDSPTHFAGLCEHLFTAEYKDFSSPDDSGGDGGNDGYSENEEMLFQFYCPTKPDVNRTRKKIIDDLKKAKALADSGGYKIKQWVFVTPRELREPEQTLVRNEAEKYGFVGIPWGATKLADLLARHKHLQAQFPDLIYPDLSAQIESARTDIIESARTDTTDIISRIERTNDTQKTYITKIEQDYKRRIDNAKKSLDSGKNETAKKEYELILSDIEAQQDTIDPHLWFMVYNNLGLSELNLNNYDRAANLFEKAYKAEPDLPMAVGKQALAKMLKGKPEEGLEIIESVIKDNPDDQHLTLIKANILHRMKNYKELIPFLRSKGEVSLTHLYEGFDRMNRKDFDDAVASFEAVLRIEPKNVKAMMLVAQNVMIGMENVVKNNLFPADKIPPEIKDKSLRAITCLKNAIDILKDSEQKKDLETSYADLSACYVAIGYNDEAIKAANEAIALDEKSAIPFLNKGIAQRRRGDYADAISSFNTAKDLGGGVNDVDLYIAFCALRTGDISIAEEIIEKRIDDEQGLNLDVAELAVDLYSRKLGKLDNKKLSALLSRLEEEFPSNPQALRIRSLYLQNHELPGAEPLIRKALANADSVLEKSCAEIDLADYYYNQKDYERAAEIYKKYTNFKEIDQATNRYAKCLHKLEDYGTLLEWVETLSESFRDDQCIKEIEADANLCLNNLEKASNILKELFEKKSELRYRVHYGMCRFRLGYGDDAKDVYNAIKNRVSSTQDLLMLASAYKGIGEQKTAIELTFKALKNDDNNPKAHLAYISTFLGREQAEGEDIEEGYVKAFQKSISEFNKRFPEETALRGFEVKDDDISEILEVFDQRSETIDNATSLYKESKAPISFIPKITGEEPFDVWVAFMKMPGIGIRMSFGAPDELAMEISTVESSADTPVVIDIYSLFLLAHLDQLNLLTKHFSRVYVHQSVFDELTESISYRKMFSRKGRTFFSKVGEQYVRDEIPPEQMKKEVNLLEKIRNFITNEEKVDICGLSKEYPKDSKDIIDVQHKSTRDSVRVAEERSIPLYCDDRILRAILQREKSVWSFSTQGFLSTIQKIGLLSFEQYFDLQKIMIELNYNYIYISAAFLLHQLQSVSYEVKQLSRTIDVLVQKETNTQSISPVLADLFSYMILDHETNNRTKLNAFIIYILKAAKKNHDLTKLEEGVLASLLPKIRPEPRAYVRRMVGLVFKNASDN